MFKFICSRPIYDARKRRNDTQLRAYTKRPRGLSSRNKSQKKYKFKNINKLNTRNVEPSVNTSLFAITSHINLINDVPTSNNPSLNIK